MAGITWHYVFKFIITGALPAQPSLDGFSIHWNP
jgi:hypothetical protein